MSSLQVPLQPGVTCRVRALGGDSRIAERLAQMGILPGMEITVTRIGPLGNPLELSVPGGQALALRAEEAEALDCELVSLPLRLAPAGDQRWRIVSLRGGGRFRARMQTLGLTPGTTLQVVTTRPLQVRLADGRLVRLGAGEAAQIIVEPVPQPHD